MSLLEPNHFMVKFAIMSFGLAILTIPALFVCDILNVKFDTTIILKLGMALFFLSMSILVLSVIF